MRQVQKEETLTPLAQRLMARLPQDKAQQIPWFLHGLLLFIAPFAAVGALAIIVLLEEVYGYLLFFGVLIGLVLMFRRTAQEARMMKGNVQDIQRLRGHLPGKISPDVAPILLSVMERLGPQPGSEAKALSVEIQDALTRVLPFLTFVELQRLERGHRAFLIETLRERTGLSGAVSADWIIAVLLTLATLLEPGAEATARTLSIRDRNERVREAALDYLRTISRQ